MKIKKLFMVYFQDKFHNGVTLRDVKWNPGRYRDWHNGWAYEKVPLKTPYLSIKLEDKWYKLHTLLGKTRVSKAVTEAAIEVLKIHNEDYWIGKDVDELLKEIEKVLK